MLILSRGAAFLLFLLLIAFLSPFSCLAFDSGVIINEIAWMGTENSSNDEWIELYNDTDAPISLENWTLSSLTGSLKINLKGMIPSKGFYLLERSDDNSVAGIEADLVYTGALKNTGEIIELRNDLVNPVDSADCSQGWLAGNNETKQTMERKSAAEWQDSSSPGGTPKQANSTATGTSKKEEIIKEYPKGILINEILPSPEGPDSEKEWIEIFNQNDFEVDLSGWKISDSIGSIKTYVFPDDAKIGSKNFLVLYRPETKIVLNNEGDGLKLLSPDEALVDSVDYGKSGQNESYGRTLSSWGWSSFLTPGAENKMAEKNKAAIKDEEEIGSTASEKTIASIISPASGLKEEKGYDLSEIRLIALTISFFSGIVILMLKEKAKQLK